MGLNESPVRYLGAISAILAIIFFSSFTGTAIMFFPGDFSPFANYLSDLGNSGLNPTGANIFNAGAILAGAFTILFFTGLYAWRITDQWQLTLVRLLGSFAGFALILVGIFSEDYGILHTISAATFFLALIISILAMDFVLRKHRKFFRQVGYYGVLVGLCGSIYLVSYMIDRDIIIAEWITVAGALLWMGLLAYNTIKITGNEADTTKR